MTTELEASGGNINLRIMKLEFMELEPLGSQKWLAS